MENHKKTDLHLFPRKKEARKVSIMRSHKGATRQIKCPKQISTSEPHRILNPNQQAWIILLNGHSSIRTGPLWVSKQGLWLLTERRFSWETWIKWNQELLGHFHEKRGQMVSVARVKRSTPGHGLASCWLPHRRARQCFQLLRLVPSGPLSKCIKRYKVKSCQLPVNCGTQDKALNSPDLIQREEWLIQVL